MTDIVERLLWTISADTPARYPDIVTAAVNEIRRLRAALQGVILNDQIGGYIPPGEVRRREPGFNIDTYDGPCATIARKAVEPWIEPSVCKNPDENYR